jgi:hypothetical protein
LNSWIYRAAKIALTLYAKVAVPVYAIKGQYPDWALTPDDPVSPFGKAEPTMKLIYKYLGRYVGDVIWLGFRNTAYGFSYKHGKPDWLKEPTIKYESLAGNLEFAINGKVRTYTLRGPDGSTLTENQRRIGPFILITGHRIQPIYDGCMENVERLKQGLDRAPRPASHPNMDARSIFSIRTSRTM